MFKKDTLAFQKLIDSEMYLSKNNQINLFSLKTIQSCSCRALKLNS